MSDSTGKSGGTAATIPAKISPSSNNKMDAQGASMPTAKAKNVSMGKDCGSSLSIKDGKI